MWSMVAKALFPDVDTEFEQGLCWREKPTIEQLYVIDNKRFALRFSE
jgi:hypothetical protein